VSGLSGIIAIAAGHEHSVALRSDGTVVAWGADESGQLANASTSNSGVAVEAHGLSAVKGVAAGGQFTLALAPPPPTVTAVSPREGAEVGGTAVTITGSEFSGATAVKFGASSATAFKVESPTSITAVSPAGSGKVDVTVTTPEGASVTSSADTFSYGFTSTSSLPYYSPVSDASFGSKGSGNGQFEHPADVALGTNGHLYVVDAGNSRIEEFTETANSSKRSAPTARATASSPGRPPPRSTHAATSG
jgi:IPT/TIG domain/Regulator of chromosome condensation (RCC1) repeat/NHL repeat